MEEEEVVVVVVMLVEVEVRGVGGPVPNRRRVLFF